MRLSKERKDRFDEQEAKELEYSDESVEVQKKRPKINGRDTILRRMSQWEFSDAQQEEAKKAMLAGVPEKKILEYFYPDIDVEEMKRVREGYEKPSA